MEINGKILQLELLKELDKRIAKLREKGIMPKIGIVTLGPEETWEAYVGQKLKLAKEIGIEAKLINLTSEKTEDVLSVVTSLNNDTTIQGLIVQRPFPTHIDTERVIQSVSKEKDIDGFRADSLYEVPVFLAVKYFINHIASLLEVPDSRIWLSNQSILIIGKGETAGNPVMLGLKKLGIQTQTMDTKTTNREELFRQADVIIFATGRRVEIPYGNLKKNSILIGIGLHRTDGKLEGDFDENEASGRVLYYTPSPGGVGPLNLYFLFDNLIKSCERIT